MRKLGWDRADVIIVSGDAYVDSPYNGVAVVGQVLMKHGFRVAVLSQPAALNVEYVGNEVVAV